MAFIHKFLKPFTDSGFLLCAAALLALGAANSDLQNLYTSALNWTPPLSVFGKTLSVQLWINDLFMAVFFFLVGLEIKREFLFGELNSRTKAALPIVAALGGMIVPAIIYLLMTKNYPEFHSGWAIPSATDIAFSLAVLSLLGRRIPISLKIFLTALAIIDDLGAIVIIAAFYTDYLNAAALGAMGLCSLVLLGMNFAKIERLWLYIALGLVLWVATLLSGVHATIAGVILAILIPSSMAKNLEHALHPYVAYFILPLFAFANSGLVIENLNFHDFTHPVTSGIIFGLFFGKQIGIFGFSWIYLRLTRGKLPHHCGWRHVYGAAILGGIGFTMSLFIGQLAFADPAILNSVKLGVIAGSLLSAIFGYAILRSLRNVS